jgi:hypothetical protein
MSSSSRLQSIRVEYNDDCMLGGWTGMLDWVDEARVPQKRFGEPIEIEFSSPQTINGSDELGWLPHHYPHG